MFAFYDKYSNKNQFLYSIIMCELTVNGAAKIHIDIKRHCKADCHKNAAGAPAFSVAYFSLSVLMDSECKTSFASVRLLQVSRKMPVVCNT